MIKNQLSSNYLDMDLLKLCYQNWGDSNHCLCARHFSCITSFYPHNIMMPIFPINKPEIQESSLACFLSQCSPKWDAHTWGISWHDRKKIRTSSHFILIFKRKFNFSNVPFAEWHWFLLLASRSGSQQCCKGRKQPEGQWTRVAVQAGGSFQCLGTPCSSGKPPDEAYLWFLPLTKWARGLKRRV